MIDPSLLEVFSQAGSKPQRGFRAGFLMERFVGDGRYAFFSRATLRTQKAAVRYGEKVVERWKRLYEAKVNNGKTDIN
jgi:hypothetical protein